MLFAHFAARLGNAGGGVPSPFDAGAGQILGYYAGHSTLTSVSAYLFWLAAICLVIFSAGLWSRLHGSEANDTAGWALLGVAGTALYAAVLLLVGLIQLALVGMVQREGGAEAVAGVAVIWAVSVALLAPASVPLLLGYGMAGRRSGSFSGLLTGLALTGAVLGLAPPPEVVGPVSSAVASGMFVLSQFQPWLLVFWLLGVAFVLRRSDSRAQADRAAPREEAHA